jgi:hypothetical protein
MTTKSRMISFRLSGQEYEILKALHPHHGARNLSDFARTAMLRHLNSEPPAAAHHAESVQSRVEELNDRVVRLQEDLQRLTSLLSAHLLTTSAREPKALQASNVW